MAGSASRLCVAAGLLLCFAIPDAHAAYRMCALRDGPRGPCTCQKDTDQPGQYTVVRKSRCRVAKPAKAPEDDVTAASPSETEKLKDSSGSVPVTTPQVNIPVAPPAPAPEKTATAVSPTAQSTGKLVQVRARGKLLCGVNTGLLGFSSQIGSGSWAGLDVDFCRAVAAAIFGDARKVEFLPLETSKRFDALTSGKIDILSRNTTWTMNREVDRGFTFAGVLYFDGQGFMIGGDRGLVSAQQLSGSKVCVESGTTTEKNMAYYFKAHQVDAEVQTFENREKMLKAYKNGDCDAYTADRSALYSDRASFYEPDRHTILPEVISKEPLGPVVLKGDVEWSEIVRWTLAGLINAEEVGLDKASASASQPLSDDAQRLVDGAAESGNTLNLSKTWLRDAVGAVGNYGEMFDANIGKSSPLGMARGINALWKRGGIVYAPPMW
jgi:general L-amino acid transport system substrate-binding protein